MSSPTEFTNEESLTTLFASIVRDAIPSKNSSRYSVVMREVDCNRGRADIVCAMFNDDSGFREANKLGPALSQVSKARILSWLTKSSLSTERYIQETTGLGRRTIRNHLRELVEMGLVEKTPKGLFRLDKLFVLPEVEIWAFEAKLTNWRRALYQALRYRGFSHKVVVVMPSGQLKAAKDNLAVFTTMNVGLVGMNGDGKIDFISRPKKSRPTSRGLYLYGLGQILSEFSQLYPNSGSEISQGLSPLPQMAVA